MTAFLSYFSIILVEVQLENVSFSDIRDFELFASTSTVDHKYSLYNSENLVQPDSSGII